MRIEIDLWRDSMSDSESFISEVNDEVRRDNLFRALKRYGWIGALAVILIVGGAAFSEYRKAQNRAAAEAVGDGLLAALAQDEPALRAQALADVPTTTPEAQAVAAMMAAAEAEQSGDIDAAITALQSVSVNGDIPAIYQQVAAFKSLTLQSDTLEAQERRQQFEALAAPGQPLSLLALEQLALIDVETGDADAAMTKYQAILQDANVTSDLQQRALQVIVALGGSPDLNNVPGMGN